MTDKSNHTPPRSLRVPKTEWDPATAEAERRGEHLTTAVRRFLRLYGKGTDPTQPTKKASKS